MQWTSYLFNVTVAGNTGTFTGLFNGPSKSISIVPPAAGSFDLEMYDPIGHYVVAETNVVGTTKFVLNEMLQNSYTILISNAPNGTYKFKITWLEF